MPPKFAYETFSINDEEIFSISHINPSRDFGTERLESVRGRVGSKLSHIIAGNKSCVQTYPVLYYDADIFRNMPYSDENFSSNIQPDYMDSYSKMEPGQYLSRENVIQKLHDIPGSEEILKELCYHVLHQEDASGNIKPLVLCCSPKDIVYWIAAVTYLFPAAYAMKISFSTYEFDPMGKNSTFRIIGVYPKGTSYDDLEADDFLIVYDMLHDERATSFHMNDSGVYDFLVNGFFYEYHKLSNFHNFLNCFSEICLNEKLESIFEFYEMLVGSVPGNMQVEKLDSITEYLLRCQSGELEIKITNQMLKLYVNYEDYDSVSRDYLVEQVNSGQLHKDVLTNQLIVCMTKFLKMPNINVNFEFLQTKQMKFNQLLLKVNENFIIRLVEKICEEYKGYFVYQGENTSIPFDLFAERNQYLLSAVLTYMNLKKIEKKNLVQGDSVYGQIFFIVSSNSIQSSWSCDKKKKFFGDFINRIKEEIRVFFGCLKMWENISGRYENEEMLEYYKDIRKQYICDYNGDTEKLCDAMFYAGYEEDAIFALKSIEIETYGIKKLLHEIDHMMGNHAALRKTLPNLVDKYYSHAKNVDSKIELYYFSYKNHLYEHEKLASMVYGIMETFPLAVKTQEEIEFIRHIEEQKYVIRSERFMLIQALLGIKKLKMNTSYMSELKTGSIDSYLPCGVEIDVMVFRNEIGEYLSALVDELMELYFKTNNPSVLIRGAFLIHDSRTIAECLEIELKYILKLGNRKRKEDVAKILNDYTIEILLYAKEYMVYEKTMAEYLENHRIKLSKLYPYIQDNTKKLVKAGNKRYKDRDITTKEVLEYWDKVQRYQKEMSDDKMGFKKIVSSLWGRKKE